MTKLEIINDTDYKDLLVSKNIIVIDNFFPENLCKEYITDFNNSVVEDVELENHRNFYQKNYGQDTTLLKYANKSLDTYLEKLNISEFMFPDNFGYEEFRLKQYIQNVGEFKPHVDVGDYKSAKRFLVYFWYLNDVDIGGETEFFFNDCTVSVKAKVGRLLMFPPLWTHPHSGVLPKSDNKYILGGYLHYV